MTQYINLTPHNINIVTEDGIQIIFPRTETGNGLFKVARVPQTVIDTVPNEDGIPIYRVRIANKVVIDYCDARGNAVQSAAEEMPAPQDGTVYLVSFMAARSLAGREDVYSPYGLIRNDEGRIIGSQGIALAPKSRALLEITERYLLECEEAALRRCGAG